MQRGSTAMQREVTAKTTLKAPVLLGEKLKNTRYHKFSKPGWVKKLRTWWSLVNTERVAKSHAGLGL